MGLVVRFAAVHVRKAKYRNKSHLVGDIGIGADCSAVAANFAAHLVADLRPWVVLAVAEQHVPCMLQPFRWQQQQPLLEAIRTSDSEASLQSWKRA